MPCRVAACSRPRRRLHPGGARWSPASSSGSSVLMMTKACASSAGPPPRPRPRRDAVESTLTGLGLHARHAGQHGAILPQGPEQGRARLRGRAGAGSAPRHLRARLHAGPAVRGLRVCRGAPGRQLRAPGPPRAARSGAPDLDLVEEAEPRTLLRFADEPHFAFTAAQGQGQGARLARSVGGGPKLLPQAVRLGAGAGPSPAGPIAS